MSEKGFTIQKEIMINVAADSLWDFIGPGFIEVYKWSSNVDHAEGRGTSEFQGAICSERYCDVNVKGFNKISERLTKYDQEKQRLAYEVTDGMPSFVTNAANEWSAHPVSKNQSILRMKADFRSKGILGALMNGVMKKKMNDTLETVLNDAKIYLETGKISKAKQKRIDQLSKKRLKVA